MTPTEILREIYRLPTADQKALREQLAEDAETSTRTKPQFTQEESDRALFDEGFLVSLPVENSDNEDDFEPVEFTGKPISETIIEERRRCS